VIVTDSVGARVPGILVTFTVVAGGGTVTGDSARSNVSGVATLGSWALGTALGVNSLQAVVESPTAASNVVIFKATGVALRPASVTVFGGDNQFTLWNTPFLAPIEVVVRDSVGSPILAVPVTFTIASGGGSVGGKQGYTTNTSQDGHAFAAWMAGLDVGITTVTASVAGGLQATFTGRAVDNTVGAARCELNSQSAAYCWGINSHGEVGDGTGSEQLRRSR
jgi:adhesin/invasin